MLHALQLDPSPRSMTLRDPEPAADPMDPTFAGCLAQATTTAPASQAAGNPPPRDQATPAAEPAPERQVPASTEAEASPSSIPVETGSGRKKNKVHVGEDPAKPADPETPAVPQAEGIQPQEGSAQVILVSAGMPVPRALFSPTIPGAFEPAPAAPAPIASPQETHPGNAAPAQPHAPNGSREPVQADLSLQVKSALPAASPAQASIPTWVNPPKPASSTASAEGRAQIIVPAVTTPEAATPTLINASIPPEQPIPEAAAMHALAQAAPGAQVRFQFSEGPPVEPVQVPPTAYPALTELLSLPRPEIDVPLPADKAFLTLLRRTATPSPQPGNGQDLATLPGQPTPTTSAPNPGATVPPALQDSLPSDGKATQTITFSLPNPQHSTKTIHPSLNASAAPDPTRAYPHQAPVNSDLPAAPEQPAVLPSPLPATSKLEPGITLPETSLRVPEPMASVPPAPPPPTDGKATQTITFSLPNPQQSTKTIHPSLNASAAPDPIRANQDQAHVNSDPPPAEHVPAFVTALRSAIPESAHPVAPSVSQVGVFSPIERLKTALPPLPIADPLAPTLDTSRQAISESISKGARPSPPVPKEPAPTPAAPANPSEGDPAPPAAKVIAALRNTTGKGLEEPQAGDPSLIHRGSPSSPGWAAIDFPMKARAEAPIQPQMATQALAQVEGGIRWLIKHQEKGAEIQLNPESLGRVVIKLHIEGGEVHARLWASEASTVTLLQDQKAALEASLRQQGLTLGSFDLHQGRRGHDAPTASHQDLIDSGAKFAESLSGKQEVPTRAIPVLDGARLIELFA